MLHLVLASMLSTAAPPVAPPMLQLAQAPVAQAAQPDAALMIANLNRMAEGFKVTLGEVQSAIEASTTSRERGTEALDRMLAALRVVAAATDERGELAQQITTMLTVWSQRHREAEDRAMRDARWRANADNWARRIREASDLRGQIVTERGRTAAMINAIQSERDLILDQYDLGQAARAVEGLRRINAELIQLNNGLETLVSSARQIQPGAAN